MDHSVVVITKNWRFLSAILIFWDLPTGNIIAVHFCTEFVFSGIYCRRKNVFSTIFVRKATLTQKFYTFSCQFIFWDWQTDKFIEANFVPEFEENTRFPQIKRKRHHLSKNWDFLSLFKFFGIYRWKISSQPILDTEFVFSGQFDNLNNRRFNHIGWKVSKYGVFGLNTGKYGPEKTPYLAAFRAVPNLAKSSIIHLTLILYHIYF